MPSDDSDHFKPVLKRRNPKGWGFYGISRILINYLHCFTMYNETV